jgi:hypothetical protein
VRDGQEREIIFASCRSENRIVNEFNYLLDKFERRKEMTITKENINVSCELEYDDNPTELCDGEQLVAALEDGSIELTRFVGDTDSCDLIAKALRGRLGVLRRLWISYEDAYELAAFPSISAEITINRQPESLKDGDTLLLEFNEAEYRLAPVISEHAEDKYLTETGISGRKMVLGLIVDFRVTMHDMFV